MSDPSANLDQIAQERLARIDERRNVATQVGQGRAIVEIASLLSTTEQWVQRVLRAIELVGTEVTPEELIMRAWHDGSDRRELVARLCEIIYTRSEYAPYPAEGKADGTWEQVRGARMSGFLTDAEFEAVSTVASPLDRNS